MAGSPVKVLAQVNRRDRLKSTICDLYEGPLICVGLNIPASLQYEFSCQRWSIIFNEALREVESLPVRLGVSCIDRNELWASFSVDTQGISLQAVKKMLVEVEERHPLGRLFDLDLYQYSSKELVPIGRDHIDRALRNCFLCSEPAVVCRRMRSHTREELKLWLKSTVGRFCRTFNGLEIFLEAIGVSFSMAITLEAVTTPKAGLVDCRGPGAHKDMDLSMLVNSGAAIAPFMVECGRAGATYGMNGRKSRSGLMALLRSIGLKAEDAMFSTTGKVNTHKGIIFTGGLLSGAAGYLWGVGKLHSHIDPKDSSLKSCKDFVELIVAEASHIACGIIESDLESLSDLNDVSKLTNGERNWVDSGSLGVRGEAVEGFPSIVNHSLPQLIHSEARGYDGNRLRVRILLSLMAVLDDGNILSRGGKNHLAQVQKLSFQALSSDNEVTGEGAGAITLSGNEFLKSLDDYCLLNNLSSGGAADMLAATLFLDGLWKKLAVLRGDSGPDDPF